MIEYKYKKRENKFTENGHTMFELDVLKRLKRLAHLEEKIKHERGSMDSIERGLIIKKVWLDKIFDEGKVWEMRSTKTKVRGKIALIESGSGMIVGEARLMGCSEKPISRHPSQLKCHQVENAELLKEWKYAWLLTSARRYKEPIPYKHPQGAVIWVKL